MISSICMTKRLASYTTDYTIIKRTKGKYRNYLMEQCCV